MTLRGNRNFYIVALSFALLLGVGITLSLIGPDFRNHGYFASWPFTVALYIDTHYLCISFHRLITRSAPEHVQPASPDTTDNAQTLPRIVWMVWLQGWDNAPPVAQASRASWERVSGWEVRALYNATLTKYLSQTEVDSILSGTKEQESISNLIRLSLLHRHGGVWADATTICVLPLDDWLPAAGSTGFFAFRNDNGNPLSTWFLAASPHHLVVERWRAASIAYWVNRTHRHIYHWVHGLFGNLLEQDPEFKKAWKSVPRMSSLHPFHFGPNSRKLLAPAPADLASELANPPSPVFKLTYKGMASAPKGSLYDVLLHYARGEPLDLPALPEKMKT